MKRLVRKAESGQLSIDEITANSNYLYGALDDLMYDRFSHSVGQPLLVWKSNDGKNVLIDGYHRLVEGILFENKESFSVEYVEYDEEHKEYIDEYRPDVYDDLNSSMKYKGLEEAYEIDKIEEIMKNVVYNH